MVLQNRVTPFGEIVAYPARGAFMGNRGILHDPDTRTLHPTRRWTSPAWIICMCEFRGRHRDVMGRNGPNGRASWTELFFLDEATALAAGHRPCFECRHADAVRFQAAWGRGNDCSPAKAAEMDRRLHTERLDGRQKRLHSLVFPVESLPDGAMVTDGRDSFLVTGGTVRRWSFSGYGPAGTVGKNVRLLTPPSTVAALRAGFAPAIHFSARP